MTKEERAYNYASTRKATKFKVGEIAKFYNDGYEQAEKDLGWHSVKESLPPMDEEVVVLTDVTNGQCIKDSHMICLGHIVNKDIAIDYDGWNIPGVTHWMYLPKNNGGR